jgi:hypothetical protein
MKEGYNKINPIVDSDFQFLAINLEYGSQDMAAFYIEVFSDGKVELTVKGTHENK